MIYNVIIISGGDFMYDKEYWERVNFTQICEFLRTGGQTLRSDIGTPEERYLCHSKAFITGMKLYKDRILAFDWNNTLMIK